MAAAARSLPTVGGVLAAALQRVGVRATPFGASRTDAGVHARAQVASFSSRADLDPERLQRAAQRRAPIDGACPGRAPRRPKSFHSHWSSIGKIYRYRISFAGEERAWRLPSARFPYAVRRSDAVRAGARGHGRGTRRLGALRGRRRRPRPGESTALSLLEFDGRGLTASSRRPGSASTSVRHLISGALGVGGRRAQSGRLRRHDGGSAQPPPKAAAGGALPAPRALSARGGPVSGRRRAHAGSRRFRTTGDRIGGLHQRSTQKREGSVSCPPPSADGSESACFPAIGDTASARACSRLQSRGADYTGATRLGGFPEGAAARRRSRARAARRCRAGRSPPGFPGSVTPQSSSSLNTSFGSRSLAMHSLKIAASWGVTWWLWAQADWSFSSSSRSCRPFEW